jgi:NADPH-dependent 2,4-dienoyl-CoA reductase/sulfur reductase-like enzyme
LAVPRLFTPELASFYEGYYEGKGVTIIKGTSVTAFEKDAEGHVRSRETFLLSWSFGLCYICFLKFRFRR